MEQNYQKHPDGCMCMMCHHGKHRLIRLVLGILILAVAFGIGVKIGELKTRLGFYGYGMMGNEYSAPYGYPSMMGGYYNNQVVAPTQSTSTSPQGYYYGPGGMMGGYYQNAQTTSTK